MTARTKLDSVALKYLKERGIDDKATVKRKLASLSAATTQKKYGENYPSLYIPYFTANGDPLLDSNVPFGRVRLFANPRLKDPPEKKFKQPAKMQNHFYLDPARGDWQKIQGDPSIPVAVTEGEVKAMCATEHGIVCIAIGGVWSWKTREDPTNKTQPTAPLPELDDWAWSGRVVELAFDSDQVNNPQVLAALCALAAELRRRNAVVRSVRLPHAKGGAKQGLDDYLVKHDAKAYAKLPRDELDLLQRTYTLSEMLADAVLLSLSGLVTLLSNPTVACDVHSFRQLTAASKEAPPNGDGNGKKILVADQWLSHPGRLTASTSCFAPGQGPLCVDPRGQRAVNTWREIPNVPPTDWKSRVKPFLDHVAYLVPDETAREQLLLWLGHLVQKPGEMAPWHVLMCTDRKEGIGRNWLSAVIGQVVSPYAALHCDIAAFCGNSHGAVFNDELSRTLFACVDEIHASVFTHGGRKMMQKLKDTLMAKERLVNSKYGRRWSEYNRTRLLVLSNYLDAMPLEREDRRFLVVRNPDERKSDTYYRELYGCLGDPEFSASTRAHLASLDLDRLERGRPMVTTAKADLFAAVEPEHVQAAREAFGEGGEYKLDVVTTPMIRALIGGSGQELNSYHIGDAMHAVGAKRYFKRVRLPNSQREYVWVLRNHAKWLNAHPDTVAAYLKKNGRR